MFKQNPSILTAFALVELVVILSILATFIIPSSRSSLPEKIDDEPTSKQPNEIIESTINKDVTIIEPSIYPSAWRGLNAAIVKWGNTNSQTWSDYYGVFNDASLKVDYIGIDVEFLIIYSDTMEESFVPNIKKKLDNVSYLMIPDQYANTITAGTVSLVFLDQIADLASTENDLFGIKLVYDHDSYKVLPPPIFTVSEGRIIIPSNAYQVNAKTGEFYVDVMEHLKNANRYIEHNYTTDIILFENGMCTEDLFLFFNIICNKN